MINALLGKGLLRNGNKTTTRVSVGLNSSPETKVTTKVKNNLTKYGRDVITVLGWIGLEDKS